MGEHLLDALIERAAERVLQENKDVSIPLKESSIPPIEEEVQPQFYDGTFASIKELECIKGTVVQINKDEVLVSIGAKSEGIIPLEELSWKKDVSPDTIVKIGEEIDVYVLKIGDEIILSKKQADREKSWHKIEKIHQQQKIVDVKCLRTTRGGLIVDIFDLRGFIPMTQVDRVQPTSLNNYEGKMLRVKILEFHKDQNNVVLSQKVVLEEEYQRQKENLINDLFEGKICVGTVVNIIGSGVFVDLGGLVGRIYLSELSWRRIKHPSDILSVGDRIKVKVLSIDKEKARIDLSYRQAQLNPWIEFAQQYKTGSVVTGKITRIAPLYAFVELVRGIEGFLPISEMADKRINSPLELFTVGEKIKVKILNIDIEKRRATLSVKSILEEQAVKEMNSYLKNEKPTTITLGELIGTILK